MRLLIDIGDTPRVVSLHSWQPEATLAQLLDQAVGLAPADGAEFFVDRTRVPGTSELTELLLLEGTRIGRSAPDTPAPLGQWTVGVTAGGNAGRAVPLPSTRAMVLGRAPEADLVLPTERASWNHCTLQLEGVGVRIRDSGSTNGTVIGGTLVTEEGVLIDTLATFVVGGAALTLRPNLREPIAPAPGSLQNLTHAATAPFNRPPRLERPAAREPVIPPSPCAVPQASRLNLIPVLTPLAMAGLLVVMLGDLRFAMFALLSPVMAIGMHLEQRRRWARSVRAEEERFDDAMTEFQAAIREAAHLEVQRLHEAAPDLSVVLRRPQLPSTRLWQRRVDQPEFLLLQVGVGDVPWVPLVDTQGTTRLDDRVARALDLACLTEAPVLADLSGAGVVGLVGNRLGALALARSLITQASVHCGPADLTIGVFCDPESQAEWEWASWLPHTRQLGGAEGARWMSSQRESSNAILRSLLDGIDALPTPTMLAVVDSEALTEGRDSPARALLGYGRAEPDGAVPRAGTAAARTQVAGIVIARRADQLPAACTTVIDVGRDAASTVHDQSRAEELADVIVAGLALGDATDCARALARFEDPELVVPGATLPGITRLPELLGLPAPDGDSVRKLWAQASGVSTPIGVGEQGPFSLDIVADGPHGLVGGTTGSGKSEFLRSLVVGLAANHSPETLNFMLIDFKGGAAFAACERLPHTIGTLSNLDAQLADRAMRSLEAELERRQRLFARVGVDDLPAYLATRPAAPLPRLMLVIDEFAMLAKDFPEVLASLVSIGAVGRTLGVHMILATQRPAGVVNDDILANTNLRVALRMQSREDSASVVGVPSAASIGRTQVGRAYVKLGQDDLSPVQTALSSGRTSTVSAESVDMQMIGEFGAPMVGAEAPAAARTDPNDLELLIDAVVSANALAGLAPPRPVWPEPLPDRVRLTGEATEPDDGPGCHALPSVGGCAGDVVRVALADDPGRQEQRATGWDLRDGNLLLIGIPGSGASTTLASLALTLAQSHSPEDLDLMCLDVGSRDLAPLAELPHTIAYCGAGRDAQEQQMRFLRHLREELQRRLDGREPGRKTVVLLDGLVPLRDEYQDYDTQPLLEGLYRAYSEGPGVGIHFAVSSTRANAIPAAIDAVTTQRWVYRLADPIDYALFGLKGKQLPAPVPGRCVDIITGLQMHVATPDRGVAAAVADLAERWGETQEKVNVVRSLPTEVAVRDLDGCSDASSTPIRIAIGLREDTFEPAILELYEGEHAMVAGPARSGKSTLLLAVAETLGRLPSEQRPALWGIHDRRSPLGAARLDRTAEGPDEIAVLLGAIREESRTVVLLVDDAERVRDPEHRFGAWASAAPEGVVIIAAARSTELRSNFGHWTRFVCASGCGVLLQPDPLQDGQILDVKLPRTSLVAMPVGRGYACAGGSAALIQAAGTRGQREA